MVLRQFILEHDNFVAFIVFVPKLQICGDLIKLLPHAD